jgi:biotin carboxyl carrier protein
MATLTRDGAPGPRAVRASVGPSTHVEGNRTIVVARSSDGVLLDGTPESIRLVVLDGRHATLRTEDAGTSDQAAGGVTRVWLGPRERRERDGIDEGEVVVDGWRFVVEIEPEARAALRERAHRQGTVKVTGGLVEVHAIIPGRIVAVNVASGDTVAAGQQLLVLEAMKMQNELRAPREGTVDRVAIAVGEDVEVGDLLLVIR